MLDSDRSLYALMEIMGRLGSLVVAFLSRMREV